MHAARRDEGMKSDPLRYHPTAFAAYDFVMEFSALTAFGIPYRMPLSRAIGHVESGPADVR
jgi:hypothetical protein